MAHELHVLLLFFIIIFYFPICIFRPWYDLGVFVILGRHLLKKETTPWCVLRTTTTDDKTHDGVDAFMAFLSVLHWHEQLQKKTAGAWEPGGGGEFE